MNRKSERRKILWKEKKKEMKIMEKKTKEKRKNSSKENGKQSMIVIKIKTTTMTALPLKFLVPKKYIYKYVHPKA